MALDIYDLIVVLVGLASLLYLYGRWDSLYFSRRGVKSLPISHIPFVGNMLKGIQRKSHFRDAIIRTYKAFPEERYVGFKQFLIPIVMLTDLELIKQVAIKDFDHFSDHIGTLNEDVDQLFGKSLFSLKGQKWRDMRATLSPAFTSSKIRGMFEFVTKCGKQMADFYVKMAKEQKSGSNLIEIEMKDAFTRYTNDVIATTAFGIEVNSLEQPENEFYMMGKSATNFRGIQMLKMFGFITMPRIMKLLNITLFSEETKRFFRSLVSGTMAEREKNHVFRPDMIQLLMEAKKGSLKHEKTLPADVKDDGFATVEEFHLEKNTVKRDWTDDDITAQALLFFVAGFDTSSTLLCFAAHELTINPDVQKRLQQEIDLVAEANGGIVSYQALQNMKFLDCVISETLRLWPPAVATDRICTKPYSLPPPNEYSQREFKLEPGKGIWIPINAIHHDPKYFKDPEKFDPERFSDENKGDIIPFTFIPFGIGPRNCIGSRFALMEAKAVLFYLLHQFDFVQIEKTQNPIRLRMDSANLDSEKGFWIGLKPRTQE